MAEFNPLQQDLTVPIPSHRVTEDMCVPVHPETRHPKNREPLKVNKPLPWTGCYHPTCHSINVWLPQGSMNYSSAYVVDEEDKVAHIFMIAEDAEARMDIPEQQDLTKEQMAQQEQYEREWDEHDDAEELLGSIQQTDVPINDCISIVAANLDTTSSIGSIGGRSVSEESLAPSTSGEEEHALLHPVVRFSIDIERVKDLPTPASLDEDHERLNR